MAQNTCTHCGAGFTARSAAHRYCSPRCKNGAGARLRRERNAARPERRCYRCGETKPAADFGGPSHTYCWPCRKSYAREYVPTPAGREKRRRWRRENDSYDRRARVKYLYGISAEKYDALLDRQGGVCALCGASEPGGRWQTWHVDHDHGHCPGKRGCETCVRGLLCNRCNLALGYFRDDPKLLAAAIRYLTAT